MLYLLPLSLLLQQEDTQDSARPTLSSECRHCPMHWSPFDFNLSYLLRRCCVHLNITVCSTYLCINHSSRSIHETVYFEPSRFYNSPLRDLKMTHNGQSGSRVAVDTIYYSRCCSNYTYICCRLVTVHGVRREQSVVR